MDKGIEANATYKTLCSALDNMGWKYKKEESNLVVRTSARGKDLLIDLYMCVDVGKQVMYLKSAMPFVISAKEKQADVVMAVNLANFSMLNGTFELDVESGYLDFKMVVPFMQSIISEEVCKYMVNLSCQMVDKFNDKFFAIYGGNMTLDDFAKFVKQ